VIDPRLLSHVAERRALLTLISVEVSVTLTAAAATQASSALRRKVKLRRMLVAAAGEHHGRFAAVF
jgi:hypothetical protein